MATTKIPVELSSTPGIVDNSNATAITIDSSERVGIGITSPGYPLEVASTATTSIAYQRTGVSAKKWGFDSDNAATYLINLTDNVRAITAYNDGKIGIGTTNPGQELDILSTGNDCIVRTRTPNANAGAYFHAASGINGYYGLSLFHQGTEKFFIGGYGSESIGFFSGPKSTASNEKMRMTSAGNFGIGTTSPTAKLEIAATGTNAAPHIKLVESGDTREFNIYNDGSGNGRLVLADSDDDTPDTEIVLADNGVIQFKTANSERMTIDSGGDVDVKAGNLALTGSVDRRIKLSDSGIAGVSTSDNTVYIRANDDDLILNAAANGITKFQDNGTERMRINSSGNVGIGTTSPGSTLDVQGNTNLGSDNIGQQYTTTVSGFSVTANGSDYYGSYGSLILNSNQNYTSTSRPYMITNALGANKFAIISGTDATTDPTIGTTGSVTSGSVRLVIDNAGNMGFGTDSLSSRFTFQGTTTADVVTIRTGSSANANVGAIVFRDGSADYCGQITCNGNTNSVSYISASDYRLKENIVDMSNATTRLNELKPKRFNWISDDNNTLVDGFLAHEVSSVVPEAVVGEKDAVDNEGNPEYQGIDHSKLVPLLVKTIQELEARIKVLEDK